MTGAPAFIAAAVVYRSLANRDRRLAVATAAMLSAALLHALYIIAIGGDYMHGRLLLPAFFAVALPASVSVKTIAVTRRTLVVVGINAFAAAWAIVSVVAFRPPPNPKSYLLSPISDFRAASHAKLHPTDIQFGLNGYEAAEHGKGTPMERPAQPEEVAPAFVFFASEADSSYITGEVLTLLGGETAAA